MRQLRLKRRRRFHSRRSSSGSTSGAERGIVRKWCSFMFLAEEMIASGQNGRLIKKFTWKKYRHLDQVVDVVVVFVYISKRKWSIKTKLGGILTRCAGRERMRFQSDDWSASRLMFDGWMTRLNWCLIIYANRCYYILSNIASWMNEWMNKCYKRICFMNEWMNEWNESYKLICLLPLEEGIGIKK